MELTATRATQRAALRPHHVSSSAYVALLSAEVYASHQVIADGCRIAWAYCARPGLQQQPHFYPAT